MMTQKVDIGNKTLADLQEEAQWIFKVCLLKNDNLAELYIEDEVYDQKKMIDNFPFDDIPEEIKEKLKDASCYQGEPIVYIIGQNIIVTSEREICMTIDEARNCKYNVLGEIDLELTLVEQSISQFEIADYQKLKEEMEEISKKYQDGISLSKLKSIIYKATENKRNHKNISDIIERDFKKPHWLKDKISGRGAAIDKPNTLDLIIEIKNVNIINNIQGFAPFGITGGSPKNQYYRHMGRVTPESMFLIGEADGEVDKHCEHIIIINECQIIKKINYDNLHGTRQSNSYIS